MARNFIHFLACAPRSPAVPHTVYRYVSVEVRVRIVCVPSRSSRANAARNPTVLCDFGEHRKSGGRGANGVHPPPGGHLRLRMGKTLVGDAGLNECGSRCTESEVTMIDEDDRSRNERIRAVRSLLYSLGSVPGELPAPEREALGLPAPPNGSSEGAR